MLDLPLRGDERSAPDAGEPEPRSEPPTDEPRPPADEPSYSRPERSERPRPTAEPPRRRRRWLLVLIAVLLLGFLGFAWYRLTTPVATFSVAALDFGEQRVGSGSDPLALTVTNDGDRPMSARELDIRGEAADDYEVVADECAGTTRGAGESCSVELRFTPSALGDRPAELHLSGNARGVLPLAGTGIAPVLAVDRPEVDFGPQPVDERGAERTLTLRNDGSAPLEVGGIAVAGEQAADFALDQGCASRALPPGEGCEVRISFAPRAAGARGAELRIDSDALSGPSSVALAGSGVWSGRPLDAAPERLDFGDQRRGRSGDVESVVFVNRTSEPVAVERSELRADRGAQGFGIADDGCRGATLPPGAECRIGVRFTPESVGRATAELAVALVGGAETTVGLTGTGVEPRLAIERSSLEFGAVRVGFDKRLQAVLSNSGTAPLEFGEIGVAGAGADLFSKVRDGCGGYTLRPSKTCTVEVRFRPRSRGAVRAELKIASDAPGGPGTIRLEGTGAAPELALDSARLEFGTVQRPGSDSRQLTISNRGNAGLTLRGVRVEGGGAADFTVVAIGCGEQGITPGGSCSVTVRFAPRSDGARAARLVIQHDADGSPHEVGLLGTALPAVPGFRLSELSIDFGTRQVGSRSAVRTLTISNPGDGRLELRGISIDGADAGDFRIVPGTCEGAPYVASGSSCTVGVRFTPSASGPRRATLRVRHSAGSGEGTVALTGQGVGG